MNMTPSSAFKDAHDPFEAPASERYARFAFDGLQIRVENNESVLWIIFDRPRKVNALSQQHYNVLHQILDELQLDRSIRVVVLASNGAHFSSGLDFDSHYRDGTPDIETEFVGTWTNWGDR